MELSDAERRWLADLEQRLAADDPALATYLGSGRRPARFVSGTRRAARNRLTRRLLFLGATVTVVALAFAAAWPAALWGVGAGAVAAVAGATLLVLDHQPLRRWTSRPRE